MIAAGYISVGYLGYREKTQGPRGGYAEGPAVAKHDKYATLRVKNKRARCAGSRAGAETASPGCAGTVESGLCRHIPVCRHTARGPRKRVYASLEL